MERSDRRQAARFEQEHKLAFSTYSEGDMPLKKKITRSLTKNISAYGAMIHSDVFLPVGDMLTLELYLEGYPEVITVVGQVRWIKSEYQDELFSLGLEFVDVPPGSRAALKAYLSAS